MLSRDFLNISNGKRTTITNTYILSVRSNKQSIAGLDLEHLHNTLGIPKERIGVEMCSWIKPQIELLFSVNFALG